MSDRARSQEHPVQGGRGITNRKRTQPVIAERGPKRALVYFGANAGPGALRPAYIAEVLAAPSAGLAALGRWRSGSAAFRVERPPRTSLRARMISKTYLLFRAAW